MLNELLKLIDSLSTLTGFHVIILITKEFFLNNTLNTLEQQAFDHCYRHSFWNILEYSSIPQV